MAASAAEKDYVHLIINEIVKSKPDAGFCICQVAEWERNYENGGDIYPKFKAAQDFSADIIIMRCIENCPSEGFKPEIFNREYKALIDYLNSENKAQIILTTGFWKHIGDNEIRRIAKERAYKIAELGEYGENDAMKAIGLFEHSGVANPPGDLGRRIIAAEKLKVMSVKNSFIHSFDDTIAIKGIGRCKETSNKNIVCDSCVLMCDWGHACELGLETMCREYNNIVYRNCDVLRGGDILMNINNGNYAEIHDVLFENIRVEYEKEYTAPQYQAADEMEYRLCNTTARTLLFHITNAQFNSQEWNISAPPLEQFGADSATAHDITAKNISVYYDAALSYEDGKYIVPILIESFFKDKIYKNILLEDITVNGEKLTMDNAILNIDNVENFTLR